MKYGCGQYRNANDTLTNFVISLRSNLEEITGESVSIFEGLNSVPKVCLFSFSIRQAQPSKFTNCRQTTVQILCRDLRENNEPMTRNLQSSSLKLVI